MKTVLLIPGFRENIDTKDYASLITAIEAKGYAVQFVPITWHRTTITDWVNELDAIYASCDPAQTILAGFSYGAMTAFVAAARQNPAELWLFSLSPYFADDVPKLRKAWLQNIGHRRAEVFKDLDFPTLARKITCKTRIFVGQAEAKKHSMVGDRAYAAHEHIVDSTLLVVPEAPHDVTDARYILAIKQAI